MTNRDKTAAHKLSILSMAKSYLDSNMHMNMEALQMKYTLGGNATHTQIEEATTQYSIEDLVATAEKLYAFVGDKDETSKEKFLTESDKRTM